MTTLTTTSPTTDARLSSVRPVLLGTLLAVVAANSIQVGAAFAEFDPHPPAAVVPLIAAMTLLGVGALPMVHAGVRAGQFLGAACCAVSIVGMGPHKLFADNGLVIAPLALVGFAFAVTYLVTVLRASTR